ncbi:hypothetical protein [uncultured Enterovirga sp.]|uniref:hypothetical protein n=1 Tax=uncultured Enterovirga sp. TaxID=2026352 RepID=UPI0035CC7289
MRAATLAAPDARQARPASAEPGFRWADPLLLGGAVLVGLILLGDRLLGDSDTQWHVAIGAEIWRDRGLPWTDTHSHTFAGAPWIAKEWLSQLLLAGAYAAAGWPGVVAVAALALSATLSTLFGWLQRRLRASVAFALTALPIMFLAPHALARPHVFALLPLLLWTMGLVAAVERGRAPSPWLLALLALWANLHGSFTIAYPLAGLMAAEAVLAAPSGRRMALAWRWGLFGLASLAAGCASPYGIRAMAVTAGLFGSGESLPFLTEWQPLVFDAIGLTALASAAALVAALASAPRANAARMAILLLLTALSVRHTRFLDVFALVAPVIAAAPLLRRWPTLVPEANANGAGPRVRWTALAILGLAAVGLAATTRPEPAAAVTPSAALAAAQRAGVAGPLYNDYDFGGFLIARGVPTFIDGRTDQLFLQGFISGVYRAVRAEDRTAFVALLDRYRVTWALVRPTSAEARHLDGAAGWRRIHDDPVAAVYVRGGLPSGRAAP